MNDGVLASDGSTAALAVSIAPWPDLQPALGDATPLVASRVDRAAGVLHLWLPAPPSDLIPLLQLRRLMAVALPLARTVGASVRLTHSGLVLAPERLAAVLEHWTDDCVPVHDIVAFDFALRGAPPGTGSIGLAALVGQEIMAWPPDEALRLVTARMVVRLAHDMLINGPIVVETEYPAPETPRGRVTLVPRDVPDPVVQIRF